MKSKNIIYFIFIFAIVLAICISGCSQDQPVKAELNTSFQLKVGQEAYIQSEKLQILLVNVTEDSRCPTDVTCVWEGQVAVAVNVSQGNHMVESLRLVERAGDKNMSVKDFNGYSIELLGVEPYPESPQGIDPSEYTASFRVSR